MLCWNTEKQGNHLVIRDGSANMVKMICDADLAGIRCSAHTLQLVLHDASLTKPSVTDSINSLKLVGYVKWYLKPLCHSRTQECQTISDQIEFDRPDAGLFDRVKQRSCVCACRSI
ncbi:hypothetical protein ACJMK2_028931 [Sinanodonta woodiana]|uniref:Uncharacterized protein n=1 Tax=Sinanodonta woodiana TaxID=1069815 RepID=A0ABD3X8M6_SINWO